MKSGKDSPMYLNPHLPPVSIPCYVCVYKLSLSPLMHTNPQYNLDTKFSINPTLFMLLQKLQLSITSIINICTCKYCHSRHTVFYLTCAATINDPTDSGEQITFVNTGVPLIAVSVSALAAILGALIGLWRCKG